MLTCTSNGQSPSAAAVAAVTTLSSGPVPGQPGTTHRPLGGHVARRRHDGEHVDVAGARPEPAEHRRAVQVDADHAGRARPAQGGVEGREVRAYQPSRASTSDANATMLSS